MVPQSHVTSVHVDADSQSPIPGSRCELSLVAVRLYPLQAAIEGRRPVLTSIQIEGLLANAVDKHKVANPKV